MRDERRAFRNALSRGSRLGLSVVLGDRTGRLIVTLRAGVTTPAAPTAAAPAAALFTRFAFAGCDLCSCADRSFLHDCRKRLRSGFAIGRSGYRGCLQSGVSLCGAASLVRLRAAIAPAVVASLRVVTAPLALLRTRLCFASGFAL